MKVTPLKCRWWSQIKSLACVVVILIAVSGYAQNADQKALEAIPEEIRPQLVEKLALYVGYQRTKEYHKLYDLFSRSTIHTVFQDQTKEEFVSISKRRFPTHHHASNRIYPHCHAENSRRWARSVCHIRQGKAVSDGPSDQNRKDRYHRATEDGDWRFSTVAEVVID